MSGVAAKNSIEATGDFVENCDDLRNTETEATYLPGNAAANLSQEHQQYLMQRHGTLELAPIPGPGGADPYNWSHSMVGPICSFCVLFLFKLY